MFTFTVTRDVGDDTNVPITVTFGVGGTATYTTDYTVSGATSFSATTGSILIPAGQNSASFTVTPVPDLVVETNEMIVLTPQVQAGVFEIGPGSAWTATITNDDGITNAILLVAFEGADNSVVFTDSSPANRVIAVSGGAKIVTANAINGGSSGSFPADGSFLTIPSSTDFNFGANNFAISLNIKTSQSADYKTLLCRRTSAFVSGTWVIYNNLSVVEVWLGDYSDSTFFLRALGVNVSDGLNHLIEFSRVGNLWQLKIDGTVASSTTNTLSIGASTSDLTVARDPSSTAYDYIGLMDDLIITL